MSRYKTGMIQIEFSDEIREAAPGLRVIQIEATAGNCPTSDGLWQEIEEAGRLIASNYELQQINKRPAIAGTRRAYKALGKDPNRYRPSAEALCRRLVNGKGIYRTTTLIDVINLISILTGYSIGGFDADKIDGDRLTLRRGRTDDSFEAIGRGPLNIDGLPVYADRKGGIGTPTSDEERTKLTSDTRHLLMLVNMYEEETPADETISLIIRLLERYAGSKTEDIRIRVIECG